MSKNLTSIEEVLFDGQASEGFDQTLKTIIEDSASSTLLINFVLENANDAAYIYDDARQIIYANQLACQITGYSKEELLKMNVKDLDENYPRRIHERLRQPSSGSANVVFETTHKGKYGEVIPVEISLDSIVVNDVVYNNAFVRDISERYEAKEAWRAGEERFRAISDASPVAIIINRASDGLIHYANKQTELMFGKKQVDLINTTIMGLFKEFQVDNLVIDSLKVGDEIKNKEIKLSSDDEDVVWLSLNTSLLEIEGENVICSAMLDVTETRELSNQLSYQATYDDLTGLVNRREFEYRLQTAITLASERKSHSALCYLDLDQFKVINDTCGHMAGDELLRQLSQVLTVCIRRDDTLARLGGDEFAILLEHCPLDNAEEIAQNVRTVVQEFRFTWQEVTFNVGVSIGLTPISQEGESVSDVLRRADSACYAAKDGGRNRVHIFQFDDEELAFRDGEMRWVARLNSALEDGRFELWQQQIARIGGSSNEEISDARSHFELLLRMRDENGELVMPGAFLPAAERYDLASKLDRWVVKETFQWFREHPDELDSLGMVAINLSGQTLSDQTFLEEITRHFESAGTPPEKICFEITETAAISNIEHAAQFMKTLKTLGCSFALDDFGSGLSSFAYLKTLPVDFVKIDGFFVKDVVTDSIDLAMVKAINDMAHAMGKLTIAEFVEDEAILNELILLGVDFVQGYGVARPMPLKREK